MEKVSQRNYQKIYEYSDYIKYNDVDFIVNLYKGILKKQVDEVGFNYYINLLRSGKKTKSEIISLLRYSKEGKEANVKLLGSKKRYFAYKIKNIPILGKFFEYFYILLTLPKIVQRLNRQEARLAINNNQESNFDDFYVKFEDKFRGSREDIKKRVEIYLPYIQALPLQKQEIQILDIGCGRGEFIELLNENGYKAKGLDLNSLMVLKSQDLGLDVIQSDALEYLLTLEDESIHVITGFHIIEHLPFEVLMKLFAQSYRVLKKGGLCIFETPNPENVQVGSQHFYSDPTHINPLVPYTVEFIANYHGFRDTKIKRLNKYSDFYKTVEQNEFITSLFYNEMDFSLIAYK